MPTLMKRPTISTDHHRLLNRRVIRQTITDWQNRCRKSSFLQHFRTVLKAAKGQQKCSRF
jgi:hypothetical protein